MAGWTPGSGRSGQFLLNASPPASLTRLLGAGDVPIDLDDEAIGKAGDGKFGVARAAAVERLHDRPAGPTDGDDRNVAAAAVALQLAAERPTSDGSAVDDDDVRPGEGRVPEPVLSSRRDRHVELRGLERRLVEREHDRVGEDEKNQGFHG